MKTTILNHDELSRLCLELALFTRGGTDTGTALSLMAAEDRPPELRSLLSDMAVQLDEGSTLAAAFRSSGRFPGHLCGLIEVGERTGRTEEALRALARYHEEQAELDGRLRAALLYPSILLLVMGAVIVVLLARVLPIFSQVYASLGGQLTGVASFLLAAGRGLNRIMPLLCVLLAAAVLLLVLFSASLTFRTACISLWLRFMGDRGICRALTTGRFAHALALCMASGLEAEDAVSLSGILLGENTPASRRCDRCLALLREGDPLSRALAGSRLLPAADCRLLEAGMASGTPDEVMARIAARLSRESAAGLERRLGQVEPTLVVAASILIGAILLSVMLPLIHIMNAIG